MDPTFQKLFTLKTLTSFLGLQRCLADCLSICGESHWPLSRIMFQRVRMAGRVLPGNLRKIQFQGLPSLYSSKRCSSRSDHRLCLLVIERPGSSSLQTPIIAAARVGIAVAPKSTVNVVVAN
jgi:hypothetical protein